MSILFCFTIVAVVPLSLLLKPFLNGVEAFRLGARRGGEQRATLWFLGLTLCEPAINIVLVTSLVYTQSAFDGPNALTKILRVTAPMLVLLIPAAGIFFRDPTCRQVSLGTLAWGITRYVCTLSIFLCMLVFPTSLLPFAIAGGIWLLVLSVRWAERQLGGPLVFPPPAPATAAPPAITSTAAGVHRRAGQPASVIPHTAMIPCPLCHAPTDLHDEACTACGLLFQSRVPPVLQRLQRYTVLRPLGPGGMGSVYLSLDRVSGRLCVIKTLASVDALADPAWRAAAAACLRNEAGLLAQLDHPRIARLRDCVDLAAEPTVGTPAEAPLLLVLEYIAGPTLEQGLTRPGAHGQLIAGAALPPARALGYAASVAETLVYLAGLARPVVHLDIKPANLILPPGSQEPVLVDFGGAALLQRELDTDAHRFSQIGKDERPGETLRISTSHLFGTPGYAAPEQYAGRASPRSDVYGLGATLYHLLTDDDPSAHPLAFPALAGLPPDIRAALTPALAREPEQRPDAAALLASLRGLAGTYATAYGPVLAAGGIYRLKMR